MKDKQNKISLKTIQMINRQNLYHTYQQAQKDLPLRVTTDWNFKASLMHIVYKPIQCCPDLHMAFKVPSKTPKQLDNSAFLF